MRSPTRTAVLAGHRRLPCWRRRDPPVRPAGPGPRLRRRPVRRLHHRRHTHLDPQPGSRGGAEPGGGSLTPQPDRRPLATGPLEQRRRARIAGTFSSDGGRTFTEVTLPVSRCAPGGLNYERASDPWLSFGPDGTLYASALSFDASTAANAVTAAVSADGAAPGGTPPNHQGHRAAVRQRQRTRSPPTRSARLPRTRCGTASTAARPATS